MKRILLILSFTWMVLWAYDPYTPLLPSTDPWDTIPEPTEIIYDEPPADYPTQTEAPAMHDYRAPTYDIYNYELAEE